MTFYIGWRNTWRFILLLISISTAHFIGTDAWNEFQKAPGANWKQKLKNYLNERTQSKPTSEGK
jgi:IS1 family transposase